MNWSFIPTTSFISLLLLATPLVNFSVAAERLADLNPGSVGSYPSNFTAFADSSYFSAYSLATGRELWKVRGTNVTLVRDINDTADDIGSGILEGNDSAPQEFTVVSNALYFSAFDPRRGGELWRGDGTNVVRVADINPDANDTIKTNPNSSWPNELTVLDGTLYFSANGSSQKPNYELWKYEGVSASLVTNIHPDSGSDWSSYPKEITAFNHAIYFMADDGARGYELWKYDGVSAVLLSDINPGGSGSSSFPKYFTPLNNELYFAAYNTEVGNELWKTDGTTVSLVTNLNPGSADSNPEFLTVFDGNLYFRANDGICGYELWRFNGTSATLVSNVNSAGDSFPKNLMVFSNALFFAADDGIHGWELWKFDGTNASLVADLNSDGDSFPESLTVLNGVLCFAAMTPATGYEIWTFDGHSVALASDINPGPGHCYPMQLAAHDNRLIFSATDNGLSDWEPWTLEVSPLKIFRLEAIDNDLRLTWVGRANRTNIVQAATDLDGPFLDISGPITVQGVGTVTTNYLDTNAFSGGVTNRFYRVIQP